MPEAVAPAALAVLLVVVGRGVDARVELAVAVAAALTVVVTGALSWDGAAHVVRQLGPTLGFLAAIFVVSWVAEAAGLFAAIAVALRRRSGSGRRVVLVVGLVAAAVTAVLSLDATAVLFTPAVIGLTVDRHASREPALLTTVEMANASSLLLPVSNLTNLLVFPAVGLTFAEFAGRMAVPTAIAVGLVTLAGMGAVTRSDDATVPAATPVTLDRFGRGVTVAIGVMLAGFLAASLAGVAPVWVAAATAAGLTVAARVTRRVALPRAVTAASPGFLVFVVALGIVVGAVRHQGLGDHVDAVVPGGDGLLALLAVTLLATALANLVNNLPATLLLLAVIPAGAAPRLLAALIGVNIGPNLTYTGSLATLLWRRQVRAAGVEPRPRAFYRMAWITTPAALLLATVALWLSFRLVA